MPKIPAGFVATRRKPDFTEDTLPQKLRGPHSTAAGAWALIHVVAGMLIYRVLDPEAESEVLLRPDAAPGVTSQRAVSAFTLDGRARPNI